jgi:predicted permease
MLSRLRSLTRALLRRRRFEESLAEEMRFHLEAHAAKLVRAGLPRDEAERRARLVFGSVERAKEDARGARGLRLFDELRGDVRFAVRLLRQAPAFSGVAILSLALGIGANTALVSVMQGVLWKPLPVDRPDDLRVLSWVSGPNLLMNSSWGWTSTTAGGAASTSWSYPAFDALRREGSPFARIFAFKPIGRVTVVIDGQAELARAHLVSGDFYEGLAVSPSVGRAIAPADDEPGATQAVAVISDGFWTRRFGRDRAIVGRAVRVNETPVTIVGVNPPGFSGLEPGHSADLFLPLNQQPILAPSRYGPPSLVGNPDYWWLVAMGRLRAGVDERAAQGALDATLQNVVRATLPDRLGRDQPHLRLLAGSRGLEDLRDEFGQPLRVLIAFVALVLLITCANVAHLLLARSAARQREISLRLALGASRARIARQMLTEGLLLALVGGAAGALIGFWSRNVIPDLLGTSWRPSPLQAQFDARVLATSLVVTLATGLLFSLAPAWQSARLQLTAALKDGGRSSAGRSRRLASQSLIVVQVAMSVVLLAGAGLFVQHLRTLRAVDLGFRPEGIVLFDLDPPRTRFVGDARKALVHRIQQQLVALPGVQSATLSSWALVGNIEAGTSVTTDGRAPEPGTGRRATVNDIGDRFFETMGIPLVQGRAIGPQDRTGGPAAAVVNRQFVRRFLPAGDPLGKTFRSGNTIYHIVGVCQDARYRSVSAPPPPTFYRSFRQAEELGAVTFEVKTTIDQAAIVRAVHAAVRSIDKDLPVFDVRLQTEQIESTFSRERLFASLTASFGALVLILASVGIYGIVANSVAGRIAEIGIRIALGAGRGRVLVMVLRESLQLTALGIVIGSLAAASLARYAETLLSGLSTLNRPIVGAAALLMLTVAVLAAWKPARFASRLDPIRALRAD